MFLVIRVDIFEERVQILYVTPARLSALGYCMDDNASAGRFVVPTQMGFMPTGPRKKTRVGILIPGAATPLLVAWGYIIILVFLSLRGGPIMIMSVERTVARLKILQITVKSPGHFCICE